MKEDRPPRLVSSAAWTGLPPETPYGGPNRPPAWLTTGDPSRRHARLVAILLLSAFLLLWVAWWVLLSAHSPAAPSPTDGHAEALALTRSGPPIYVMPAEALVSRALAVAAFAVPVAYLAWTALRRRMRR